MGCPISGRGLRRHGREHGERNQQGMGEHGTRTSSDGHGRVARESSIVRFVLYGSFTAWIGGGMTSSRNLTELEGTALGVIWAGQPCTPYRVRRVFLDSPSPSWSGSAGAIYPLI